jgi:hypothetical protein
MRRRRFRARPGEEKGKMRVMTWQGQRLVKRLFATTYESGRQRFDGAAAGC